MCMRVRTGHAPGRAPRSQRCIILISSACDTVDAQRRASACRRWSSASSSSVGHLDRLRVVADHALHELDVRRGEAWARQRGCARRRQHFRGLSGCAGLDDGRRRAAAGRCGRRLRRPARAARQEHHENRGSPPVRIHRGWTGRRARRSRAYITGTGRAAWTDPERPRIPGGPPQGSRPLSAA